MDNFTRVLEILQEEFYGNQAVVYHRTNKPLEVIESNFIKGMIAGRGNFYGKGVYSNYELEDCMTDYSVKQYGEFIVKCKVSLHGFLILDYDVARLVYGEGGYRLHQQFKRLEIPVYPDLLKDSEWLEKSKNTSEVLFKIYENVLHCNGVIYTGTNDNRCLICYEPKLIIPMAVTNAKTMDEVNWFKLDSTHTIRNYLSVMGTLKKPKSSLIKLKSGIYIPTNLSRFEIKMEWLESMEYCKYINYQNKTNWRLPTMDEMLEIRDYYQNHRDDFQNVSESIYWTSIENEDDTFAFTLKLRNGAAFYMNKVNEYNIFPVCD